MRETDISTLRCEEIEVDNNNGTATENLIESDDILPTPSSLTFGFNVVNLWRQSGNLPVDRAKLKVTPNSRMHHIYGLNFFIKFYFMDYMKDVVIHESIKSLMSAINLSEYFFVIGCRLIMDYYVGHSVKDFFLKDPIKPQKGATIHLNHIISGRSLHKITGLYITPIFPFMSSMIPFYIRGLNVQQM